MLRWLTSPFPKLINIQTMWLRKLILVLGCLNSIFLYFLYLGGFQNYLKSGSSLFYYLGFCPLIVIALFAFLALYFSVGIVEKLFLKLRKEYFS